MNYSQCTVTSDILNTIGLQETAYKTLRRQEGAYLVTLGTFRTNQRVRFIEGRVPIGTVPCTYVYEHRTRVLTQQQI